MVLHTQLRKDAPVGAQRATMWSFCSGLGGTRSYSVARKEGRHCDDGDTDGDEWIPLLAQTSSSDLSSRLCRLSALVHLDAALECIKDTGATREYPVTRRPHGNDSFNLRLRARLEL